MSEVQKIRFVIGLPEMDDQHSYLYDLFDRIESAFGRGKDHFKPLLEEIERYLMFHFESEEHLMRMYDYPGFAVHQSDHETAGNRFVQFLDDYDAGVLNPAALRIFLSGWLSEHSRQSDTGYVAWVTKKRALLS